MPRATTSKASVIVAFFRSSPMEIAEMVLDMARDAVRDRKANSEKIRRGQLKNQPNVPAPTPAATASASAAKNGHAGKKKQAASASKNGATAGKRKRSRQAAQAATTRQERRRATRPANEPALPMGDEPEGATPDESMGDGLPPQESMVDQ